MEALTGKVAVITGAASGIGRALAVRCASEGMAVVLADLQEEELHRLQDDLRGAGSRALAVVTDVTDPAAVHRLADVTCGEFGTAHLLCNNAGVSGSFSRSSVAPPDEWRWVFDVNFWGAVYGIQAFLPILEAQNEGHIVNTGSGASWDALPGMAAYAASKHALLALSEALYRELLGANSAVGVSLLCPSLVNTAILESDRHRPASVSAPLADEDPTVSALGSMLRGAITNSAHPEDVATAVIAGVLTKEFIISNQRDGLIAAADRRAAVARGAAPSPSPQ